MRVQNKPKTADPQPGRELLAWANTVARLQPDRDRAAFDLAKAQIVAGLQRLAGELRLTR